jgi:hypothetical protein
MKRQNQKSSTKIFQEFFFDLNYPRTTYLWVSVSAGELYSVVASGERFLDDSC